MSILMGARGVGSLIGPLIGGQWARRPPSAPADRDSRGLPAGRCRDTCSLGAAGSLVLAAAAVMLAHAGTSTNWVFSTTLLQVYTSRPLPRPSLCGGFRTVYAGISASSYVAGVAIDWGMAARTFAMGMGAAMLVPAAAWGFALRKTRGEKEWR